MKTLIPNLTRLQCLIFTRTKTKTTTLEYVSARALDPNFDKLMDQYKWLYKVVPIQDLIIGDPNATSAHSATVPLDFLHRLSQKLRLNRGAKQFLYKFPHIFTIFYHTEKRQQHCRLTDTAADLWNKEQEAIVESLDVVVDRLIRVLSMSVTKAVPIRAINKVYRELGLPEDYEESVILRNKDVFRVEEGEGGIRMLRLVKDVVKGSLVASVESWRAIQLQRCNVDGDGDSNVGSSVDEREIRYSFKHGFPPGMRLKKSFKEKVRKWQRLKYVYPYTEGFVKRKTRVERMKAMEKRAVGIVHEFMSLTVEKMVEVERISHFRKSFGIHLNIRDLFLNHPGMFYLSAKGYRHTVFLREAYERGRLIDPNPVYEVRRKLLDLVLLGRHGMIITDAEWDDRVRQGGEYCK